MSTQYAIIYYYPVEASKIYDLSTTNEWFEQYPAIGFMEDVPAIGGSWETAILYSGSPAQTGWMAPKNGYILLLYANNSGGSYIKVPIVISLTELSHDVETLKTNVSGLQTDVKNLRGKFKNYELVQESDLTLLGNYYLNKQDGHKISQYSTCELYYYPVVAGRTYRIKSELDWFEVYDSIGFSTEVPVLNGTYTSVLPAKPPVEESFFSPTENGYILLGYVYDKKSYVYEPLEGEISLIEIEEDIEKNKDDIEVLKNETPLNTYPLKKNIICSGSSITWGGGPLESSMVGYVDNFLHNKLAKTLLSDKMTFNPSYSVINNGLLYGTQARKIEGVGSYVEFDLYSDEIDICQMKRRTTDYGVMKITADNVEIGVFDNKNEIGSEIETFTGDAIREVKLKHPCTFNHRIYINGSSTPLDDIAYNMDYDGHMPSSGCNAWIFRSSDGDGTKTCHSIQLASSLGTITSVRVEYDYGRIIAHERSTVGQTSDEYTNESCYGKGSVSYDPDQPSSGISSGLEFRAVDKRAHFIHKFSYYKLRHYKIEIIGGVNPYFAINFASSRFHNLMNAGIGGWKLYDLMHLSNKLCHWTQFFKYWHPDVIFEEAMTNDDWNFSTRRISRSIGEITLSELQKLHQLEVHKIAYNSSTDKYAVEMCTGIIQSITPTSLISSDIIGTETQVGDIIRIGNYHSDMHQITCRRLTEVNLTTGEVKWIEPIVADDILMIEDLSDLVGAEINIRNLNGYKNYYKELIEHVHSVSQNTKIVVVHNGLPNLYTRQLWGYEIVHAELCNEYHNVAFINTQEHIYNAMFNTISGTRKETVQSTGASSYDLSFGGTGYGGWQGFQVLVNGVDVYGKDAYIEMDMAYRLNTNVSGSNANKTNPYDRSKSNWNRTGAALKLYFIKNVPTANDTIEIRYADAIWSEDFCHVTSLGAALYAETYNDFIETLPYNT